MDLYEANAWMEFKDHWINLAEAAFCCSLSHGFWPEYSSIKVTYSPVHAEKLALIHSELSEVLEALRCGNSKSEKIPAFSHVEEELADAVIRIMDFGYAFNYDIAGAINAKMAYNTKRPYLHGKVF